MEEWVQKALKRWPNVPALFGWLRLDRRGRWLIQNELITRPQIIEVFNRNYAVDEQGRWYFQNGPQRGYMQLDYAPLVLRTIDNASALQTHNELRVTSVRAAYIDETGAVTLSTEHGPGAIVDDNLDWVLERLRVNNQPVAEAQLQQALSLPSGNLTELSLVLNEQAISLTRLDAAQAPKHLGFVREPQP